MIGQRAPTLETAASYCQSVTVAGNPCRARAIVDGHCAFHADRELAAELGRRGGRNNRHHTPEVRETVTIPRTVHEVRDFLAEVLAGVRAGHVEPKIARALVGVGSLLLEAIEAAAVRDAADSAARWKIESAVRTDEELMFFAKNGYWPEDPSLLNEVSPNEVNKPNG